MLVQVGNELYTLAEGEPLQVPSGGDLRVFYSFNYTVDKEVRISVWGSLFDRILGIRNRKNQAQTKQTIVLEAATDWQQYQGYIDINLGVGPGVYGLVLELPDFGDAEEWIDDCIEVTQAAGITDWMGTVLMIAMMGMMMPIMQQMTGGMNE